MDDRNRIVLSRPDQERVEEDLLSGGLEMANGRQGFFRLSPDPEFFLKFADHRGFRRLARFDLPPWKLPLSGVEADASPGRQNLSSPHENGTGHTDRFPFFPMWRFRRVLSHAFPPVSSESTRF